MRLPRLSAVGLKARNDILLVILEIIFLLPRAIADDAVLTLPGEAKGAAVGEAYSASASGAEGLWYNPATLARRGVTSLSLMHTAYLEDVTLNTLGVAMPFGSENAVGVGVSYLNVGSIPSFDNTGAAASSYSPKDVCARLGYARSAGDTSFGFSAFFLQSTIVDSASTIGLNAGLHQNAGALSFALVAENFGGKLKYRDESASLPQRLRAGASLRLLPGLSFNAEVFKPKTGAPWVGVGSECRVASSELFGATLRGGYNSKSGQDVSGLHGLSAGAGFEFKETQLNYAWVPLGDLGQTHRLSVDFQFGDDSSNPNSREEIRSRVLIHQFPNLPARKPKVAKAREAAALPVLPWKKYRQGRRTSKDKVMDLLARDALCTGAGGARALVTRTRGTVELKMDRDQKKWVRVRADQYLFENDVLRTYANAYAHLIFANGVKTEVGANTVLTIRTQSEICEKAVTELAQGELVALSEDGNEMRVETPLGVATIKEGASRVRYDGKTISMRVQTGSGTFAAGGVETPVSANKTFIKTSDGKTQLVSNDTNDPFPMVRVTEPNSRSTPGRWDAQFAKTFERELMRLDSVPGLALAEYVRDTAFRNDLKLGVYDQLNRQKEMQTQIDDFTKDMDGFKELKASLQKQPQGETKAQRKERQANFRQVSQALKNAQRSLKGFQKELKNLIETVRDNEEYLAAIPIVRMLNITAQESTVPFEKGRSIVPEQATGVLDAIAESMMQLKPFRVVVEGHTDKSGSARANTRLSKQRAEAVAQYLRKKTGSPARLFVTKGMGASQPLEEGDVEEIMAKNRRVEIWFELRGL